VRNNLVIQNGRDCVGIRHSQDLGGLDGLSGNPGTDYNAFFDTAGACMFFDRLPAALSTTAARWRSGVPR
jgi:hypothetical protein